MKCHENQNIVVCNYSYFLQWLVERDLYKLDTDPSFDFQYNRLYFKFNSLNRSHLQLVLHSPKNSYQISTTKKLESMTVDDSFIVKSYTFLKKSPKLSFYSKNSYSFQLNDLRYYLNLKFRIYYRLESSYYNLIW